MNAISLNGWFVELYNPDLEYAPFQSDLQKYEPMLK
jgi:hypothetical protein